MRIGYLDCVSGISGDMMLGALIDLGVPLDTMNEAVRSLGIADTFLSSETVNRKGFRATKVDVHTPHEHAHRGLNQILSIVGRSETLTPDQKSLVEKIFTKIAEAESKVHGIEIEKVHFHEVGAVDSIVDVVAAVVGLDYLRLDALVSSPVPTGCGTISIAHGTCSVPAPATAELLQRIPIAPSDVPFELTTPTGAALLAVLVRRFGAIPTIRIEKIGYGAGTRDLSEQANILRFIVGEEPVEDKGKSSLHPHEIHDVPDFDTKKHEHESREIPAVKKPTDASQTPHFDFDHQFDSEESFEHRFPSLPPHAPFVHEHWIPGEESSYSSSGNTREEEIWVLETNLDDFSGEMLGYCVERLWELPVLDVYTTPIFMKKNRPGVVLTVLCRKETCESVQTLLFRETTTLGIRKHPVLRTVLSRNDCTLDTPWGAIAGKAALLPDGTERVSPEYESAKRLAEKTGIPLKSIYESARKAD